MTKQERRLARLEPSLCQPPAVAPPQPPFTPGEDFVYLIAAEGGLTKIGKSNNPQTRLHDLQHMSPVRLELLWVGTGGQPLERELHRRFADRRRHGEWFDFSGASALEVVATEARRIWPAIEDVTAQWLDKPGALLEDREQRTPRRYPLQDPLPQKAAEAAEQVGAERMEHTAGPIRKLPGESREEFLKRAARAHGPLRPDEIAKLRAIFRSTH